MPTSDIGSTLPVIISKKRPRKKKCKFKPKPEYYRTTEELFVGIIQAKRNWYQELQRMDSYAGKTSKKAASSLLSGITSKIRTFFKRIKLTR